MAAAGAKRTVACFKSCPRDHDPRELLDPANQVSTPWGGHDHGPCDKCRGEGTIVHECLSCLAGGTDPECPACGGRVRYADRCPTCEGDGVIDRTRRDGVSAFPTIAGLLRYLAEDRREFDGHVIVELEGELTGDVDLDAERGAILVRPTRVVGVHEIDPADVG
jgi:hypothetical protein